MKLHENYDKVIAYWILKCSLWNFTENSTILLKRRKNLYEFNLEIKQ